MVHSLLLVLVELVAMLALSVVLSSYERRSMSLLHNRDAPIAYLLLGMGQPIADGGKLVMKTSVSPHLGMASQMPYQMWYLGQLT